jgi:hypothetical protein
MALIALLFAAATFTATPEALVLGRDPGCDLTVRAPGAARVAITSSVGLVSAVTGADGVFHARFTPPALNAPSVALLLAVVDGGALSWLSLPLSGSDTLPVETRPQSKVEVEIGGKTFGPVTSDRKGNASLHVVVPPGVREATLHITDRQGNRADRPLDLEPAHFSRLRIAARAEEATSASPTELEVFVVQPDGRPDRHASVTVTSDRGEVRPAELTAPGIYVASVLAPAGESQGELVLEAKASGQLARLTLPVRPRAVLLAQPFWQSDLATRQPWARSLGAVAGTGVTFDGAGVGTLLLEFAMRVEVLPIEAVAQLGGSVFTTVSQGQGERAGAKLVAFNLGARAGYQLRRGLDAHVSLLLGLQDQFVHTTLSTKQVLDLDATGPRAALALGTTWALGPGRLLLQVQLDSTPSGLARLIGSLGSAQLQAGYLFGLR